ncbi:MAG: C1 family peptidase [Candidatus Wallbacteria bacterium]|nr:C1 family peptidase [Candidatus Wallbacteria bacterium]
MPVTRPETTITRQMLAGFRKSVEARPECRVAMNACTNGNIKDLALNRQALNALDWEFSHEVPHGQITAQRQAGTCWLFAALNWLRKAPMKKLNLENFEFSQNYCIFWDKLEKANRFLEDMIEYRDRELDDRRVHALLNSPLPDGGEWHMLTALVRKYGLLPKAAMADTFHGGLTDVMNPLLFFKLREGAMRIRELHRKGKGEHELRKAKIEVLETLYRMLVVFLGEPPARFDFGYRDKKKRFHRAVGLTPHTFYEKYVGVELDRYVSLLSSPLPDTPFGRTFVIEHNKNDVEGPDGVFLNVPMETLHRIAVAVTQKGALLFGCDVLQSAHRPKGILDTELFDFEEFFGTTFEMDRATRMATFQMKHTHAMVFLGVDMVGGKAAKWKVENSWGPDVGQGGVFVMTDRWFLENVYGIIVHEKQIPRELRAKLSLPPIVLPTWHPLA